MVGVNIAILVLVAVLLSLIANERIEITLPMAACVIILFLYTLSILGIMGIIMYVTLWIAIVILAIYVVRRVRITSQRICITDLLITPGLAAFLGLSAFMWWFSKENVPTQWDEFSHWALTVKDMYFRDRLSTDMFAVTGFKTYPPAMAIWQYFFVRWSAQFKDGIVYYAYNMFLVLMMMPIFWRTNWRRIIHALGLVAIVYAIPYLFYTRWEGVAWSCLYIDRALALCFCFALLSYFLEEKPCSTFVFIRTGCALAVLGLLKSTGNFTAAIAVILFLVDVFLRRKQDKWDAHKYVKKFAVLITLWITAVVSWKIYLIFVQTPDTWSASRLTVDAILKLFSGKAEAWEYEFTAHFLKHLTTSATHSPGRISVSFVLQPFVWLVIMLAAQWVTGWDKRCIKRILTLWGILTAGYVIYIASLYMTYLFLFTKDEAFNLAGIYRYTAVYWLGAMAFSIITLADASIRAESIVKSIVGCIAAVVFVLALVPLDRIEMDLKLNQKRKEVYVQDTAANLMEREKIMAAHAQMKADSKVYILSTDPQWYLIGRYEMMPNRTCGWGEWIFYGDLRKWKMKLIDENFDYVWVESVNEDFRMNCGSVFENGITSDTLYRIEQNGEEVTLVRVTQ